MGKTQEREVDIIILGAGPAGISTALHLLQLDPSWAERMLVIDKATHPRHKLCGGGVTRFGLAALAGLGFHLPLPLPQAQVDDVRLTYGGKTIHVRGEPQVSIFHRAEFDAFLAQEARRRGVRMQEGEPALDYTLAEDGVHLVTRSGRYRAQVLVGADGSKGLVRRKLGPSSRSQRVARLLEVLQPADAQAQLFTQKGARFDFNPVRQDLQGYTWDFPAWVGGQAVYNRGIYDARVANQRPRPPLPALLARALDKWGGEPAGDALQGHPIHWFSPQARLAWPRLVLVGDTAGAEPLFGEGIGPALGYGKVAAGAIMAAFASGDFSFRDYRRRVLAAPLGRYLLLRYAVAWLCYHAGGRAWFMRNLWRVGDGLARLWPAPAPLYHEPTRPVSLARGE